MAASIGVGAYLIVPIGPVPVSMQPFFVFLTGYVLGPRRGVMAVGLYLLAGIIGLPVFAGGRSGLGHLFGPTGGYLFAWTLGAWFCGLARKNNFVIPWLRGVAFGVAGLISIYLVGAVWLKFALSIDWGKAVIVGVVPFIAWDAIKIVLALLVSRYLSSHGLLPGQR